jgi:hypothetical protein
VKPYSVVGEDLVLLTAVAGASAQSSVQHQVICISHCRPQLWSLDVHRFATSYGTAPMSVEELPGPRQPGRQTDRRIILQNRVLCRVAWEVWLHLLCPVSSQDERPHDPLPHLTFSTDLLEAGKSGRTLLHTCCIQLPNHPPHIQCCV